MWNGLTQRRCIRPAYGLVVAALAAVGWLQAGCDESTTEPAANNTAGAGAAVTINDVRSKVEMTDQQAAALETALADLEQTRQARRNARDRDAAGPAPQLEFLARASQILDREQLTALVQAMAERREANRAEQRAERGPGARRGMGRNGMGGNGMGGNGMGPDGPAPGAGLGQGPAGPGSGPGMHGPRHGRQRGQFGPGHDGPLGPLAGLDLSAEQQTAVREAAGALHEAMQTLHAQFRAGTLSEAEFRDGVAQAHTQFQAAVAAVLTPEQSAKWQELRREHASTALERGIERLRTNQERHLELLGQILGLDETQRAGFATIGADLLAKMEALLQGVRDGSIAADQVRAEGERIHTEARTALRALLTPDQATLFDALDTFLHRPRGRMR